MTGSWRVADDGDLARFYGRPIAAPITAIAWEVEGATVGVAGVAWCDDGRAWGFVDCPLRFMPSAVKAVRLARTVLAAVAAAGEEMVFVCCDRSFASAPKWLRVIGFEPVEGDVWVWKGSGHVGA